MDNRFDEIKNFDGTIFAIRVGYRWGLIDNKSNSLSRIIYDHILFEDGKIVLLYSGYKFIIHPKDLPLKFDCLYEPYKSLPNKEWTTIVVDGKCGAIDTDGTFLIPCKYDSIKDTKGAFWCSKTDLTGASLYDVYSYEGECILDSIYPYMYNIIYKKHKEILYGILNDESRLLVEIQYDGIEIANRDYHFYNESLNKKIETKMYVAYKSGIQYLCSSKKGLIPIGYNRIDTNVREANYYYCYRDAKILDIYYFDEFIFSCDLTLYTIKNIVKKDLFVCQQNLTGKYGLLDPQGCRIPFLYDRIEIVHDCFIIKAIRNATFSKENRLLEGKVDIIDFKGYYISQDKNYKELYLHRFPSCNIFKIRDKVSVALYDIENGEILPPGKYNQIDEYDDGYAKVSSTGFYGVTNNYGIEIVPCKYRRVKRHEPLFFIAEKENGLVECYTLDGRIINYSFIGKPQNGFMIYSTLYKAKFDTFSIYSDDVPKSIIGFGVINIQGDIIVECKYKYDDIHIISETEIQIHDVLYKVKNPSTVEKIKLGEGITLYGYSSTSEYLQINKLENDFAVARNREGKWGCLDKYGNVAIPFIYDFVEGMRKDGTSVVSIGANHGIVTNTGSILLPVEYIFYGPNNYSTKPVYYNGLTLVKRNGLFGFLDTNFREVIPCKFPGFKSLSCSKFHKLCDFGYLVVENEEFKIGLVKIENPNEYIAECIYDEKSLKTYNDDLNKLKYISLATEKHGILINHNNGNILRFDGLRVVKVLNEYIILQELGKNNSKIKLYSISQNRLINSFDYEDFGNLDKNDYLQVNNNKKWGIFDLRSQKEIIPCIYYGDEENKSTVHLQYFNFNDELAAVRTDTGYGFINNTGSFVIKCEYEDVRPFKEGYAAVFKDSQWRFIDKFGIEFISGLDDCLDFSDGLAAIKKNGYWGFVNTQGKIVIPCKFKKAQSFSDGLAAVAFKKYWGYIDKSNNTVIPFSFRHAYRFINGIADVTEDDGRGRISKNGKWIEYEPDERDFSIDDDYERDTWYAMTDGMYGDMPDGWDGDYEFLGY